MDPPVILHCKPGCPACDKAEELFRRLDVPYSKVTYHPDSPGYAERRDAMFSAHGHRSFPNVFIGGVFAGGFSDLADSHRLDRLLAAAGVEVDDIF